MGHTTTTQRTSARVRAILAERRLAGAWLAGQLGMPTSTLNRRLTSRLPWDLDELDAVSAALDVPVTDLITPGDR